MPFELYLIAKHIVCLKRKKNNQFFFIHSLNCHIFSIVAENDMAVCYVDEWVIIQFKVGVVIVPAHLKVVVNHVAGGAC